MVSLRFPFLFSQPLKLKSKFFVNSQTTSGRFSATAVALTAAAAGAAALVGVAANGSNTNPEHPLLGNALSLLFSGHFLPPWASVSLADNWSSADVVDFKTGFSFPSVLGDTQRLLGIGLRRKSVLGLKNIDVYAFGFYVDGHDLKESLTEKYGKLSVSEIKENNKLSEDLLESGIGITVRLQIVYGKLSIRSVRSAFEESVGSRLRKFGGPDNNELLKMFTSQFKDEYEIPRGSVIELSRKGDHVLCTTIHGKEVGSIKSKLLCRSIFDLYIGDDPFDRQAMEDIKLNLASLLQK